MALFICIASNFAAAGAAKIGIVTMHTPSIKSYANSTEAVNLRYAERWGYGFHVLDHVVDRTRVPHWSKIHAVQMYLPEYDFVLWIDADALVFDHDRRIEDVMGIDSQPDVHIWAQDIWPDYPSIHRKELIDTGIALFRNSRWTRQFLIEMYYDPGCAEHLNWTEQYCFTVAHRKDLLGMRDRIAILPTPTINHHILPPPENTSGLFIFHLAGRPSKARAHHFAQVHDGRALSYRESPEFNLFWQFRKLFAQHRFGGIASLQACLFGIGDRHRAFLDALLFHFPYLGTFTIVRQGAPRLWTQMKATEEVGERFPDRMAHMDVREYMLGTTRDGDKFVEGFFCDIFVLGVESWRHLPSLEVLSNLARSGLEPYSGEKNKGFGYSALRDVYFVWLHDGCEGGDGAASSAAGASIPSAVPGHLLDDNDEDGSAMAASCDLLGQSRRLVESALSRRQRERQREEAEREESPMLWGVESRGQYGFESSGTVALARAPREAFLEVSV